VLAIDGFVVYKNAGKWARAGGAKIAMVAVDAVVDSSPLPDAEKAAIKKPLENLVNEFKAGDMDLEQFGTVLKTLADGPLMTLITLRTFELMYIEKSALSDEEKEAARVTVSRYAEGKTSGKIEGTSIQDIVWEETTDEEGNTTNKLKETLSPEELQQCLTIMKTAADEASIADQKFPMDIGAAIEKGIADARAEMAEQ